MMKKSILLVTILVATLAIAFPSFAQSTKGDTVTVNLIDYVIGGDTAILINGKNRQGSVTIPKTINYEGNNYRVTAIGDRAFESSTKLTIVVIQESVTSIGKYAFSCCCNLSIASISESVTSIGDGAFQACTKLSTVNMKCKVVGNYMFDSCISLNTVNLGDPQWGSCVTSIGNYAFSDCTALTSITLPKSLTTIGDYAFESCSGLSSITFPDSIKSIGDHAFDYCSNLATISFSNSACSIGNSAFAYCTSLANITFPNSAFSIGEYAFVHCTRLSRITIPGSVTSIGTYAFGQCSNLSTIILQDGIKSIGSYNFAYCTNLTSIIIPNSVTSIGEGAFLKCKSLNKLTIGKGLKDCTASFGGCTALTDFVIDDKNPYITTNSGMLLNKKQNVLIAYPSAHGELEPFPSTIDTIANYALGFCDSLISVTIPKTVNSIGDGAFKDCSNLKEVYSKRKEPLSISALVFLDVPRSEDTLYVPTGCKSAYQSAAVWKTFGTITEMDFREKGDLNDDDHIDVSDLTALNMLILNGEVDNVGDIDGNGKIDVSDVTALINIILGNNE